jgi:superfamily II DNA or RNA helicase
LTTLGELIRHDLPLMTDGESVYPYSYELAEKYRFKPRFGETVILYKIDGDMIRLPRELCPVGKIDNRAAGKKVAFPKSPTPRANQETIFEQTAAFLAKGQSGIVSAYTGWGKTVLGMYAAASLGVKTLVITTKDDVYRKWYDDAKLFLGLPDHEVGEIRGNKCEVVGTKFVVAMIHSLSKDGKYPPELQPYFDEFGLVIFDEVQRLPADHFQACAGMFRAKLRLGLSAKFQRPDGKELLILAHVGPVRAKTTEELMIPTIYRVRTEWRCPRVYVKDKKTGEKELVVFPHEAGKTAHIEKSIAEDAVRSFLIGKWLKVCFDRGRKIVAFSTLHDHLVSLAQGAVKQGIPKEECGFYIGATTKKEREERDAQLQRRIIFTTYGMMGEGTDVDWLDTCFLCMPRANVLQPVGRIRRLFEDKRPPTVFDFLDEDSPVFAAYGRSRERWYSSIKADVSDIED